MAEGDATFIRIKNGATLFDRDGWVRYLSSLSFLRHDKRHFDFGESLSIADWWEISNQPDKEISYAYSTTPQPLHCDNAWFSDPAEVNFFMMERQAIEGGAQTLYRLADILGDLETDAPDLLKVLSTVPVIIKKGETDLAHHTTIIQMEPAPRIFWNYYRTRKDSAPVNEMCERFFAWLKKQEQSGRVRTVRMDTGDCFFFNDQKMLHGRTRFSARAARDRVLLQSMWKYERTSP